MGKFNCVLEKELGKMLVGFVRKDEPIDFRPWAESDEDYNSINAVHAKYGVVHRRGEPGHRELHKELREQRRQCLRDAGLLR